MVLNQPLGYAIFIAFQRTSISKAYNIFYIIGFCEGRQKGTPLHQVKGAPVLIAKVSD